MGQDLVPLLLPLLGGAHAIGDSGETRRVFAFAQSVAEQDKIVAVLSGVADLGQVRVVGDTLALRMNGEPVQVGVWSVARIERIIADAEAGLLPTEPAVRAPDGYRYPLADLALIRPLADPFGLIARWQERIGTYPPALRMAIIARLTGAAKSLAADDPQAVVQRQLEAYNAHDLEGFLATYAGDVQLERHNEISVGLEPMRARYGPIFAAGRCRAEISARMCQGEWVVDHETAYGLGPEPIRVLVAYRVRDGVIDRVRFMA